MPIKHAIWRVGEKPVILNTTKLASESQLEEMIATEPNILSSEWMLIGRQENAFGGRIDFLAVSPDSSLVLIELKRSRTPRDTVAQALDYASWVEQLTAEKIAQIYQRFSKGGDLEKDFFLRFNTELDEETLNQSHQIIVVASELDNSTERIINYLNARDIAINALFFQVFEYGKEKFLSRAWLIDPGETQVNAASASQKSGEKKPWNGEYYVSFGDPGSRSWDDAVKYGFISGGGGIWYSQTLKMLSPGDRVWVKIPKTGYVGVGRVTDSMQPASDFKVKTDDGNEVSCLEVLKHAEGYKASLNDPEKTEYFVRVEWLDVKPENLAFDEIGLFGNQNTVCQPTTPKWLHTVERLKSVFKNWDKK